jgi:hypothetical protein
MVSYPGELPEGSRRARPRRQKMFSNEEAARVLMREGTGIHTIEAIVGWVGRGGAQGHIASQGGAFRCA